MESFESTVRLIIERTESLKLAFEAVFSGRVLHHMLASILVHVSVRSGHGAIRQSFLLSEAVVMFSFSGVVSELRGEECVRAFSEESIIDN